VDLLNMNNHIIHVRGLLMSFHWNIIRNLREHEMLSSTSDFFSLSADAKIGCSTQVYFLIICWQMRKSKSANLLIIGDNHHYYETGIPLSSFSARKRAAKSRLKSPSVPPVFALLILHLMDKTPPWLPLLSHSQLYFPVRRWEGLGRCRSWMDEKCFKKWGNWFELV
jgi:hypothetical protein